MSARRSSRRDHDGDDLEELRATLREHAREAERQRDEATAEIDALKQSLRRRIDAVAAREQELEELIRRVEREQVEQRSPRRRSRGDGVEREVELERRAQDLDTLARELARRERELERRERSVAAREDG